MGTLGCWFSLGQKEGGKKKNPTNQPVCARVSNSRLGASIFKATLPTKLLMKKTLTETTARGARAGLARACPRHQRLRLSLLERPFPPTERASAAERVFSKLRGGGGEAHNRPECPKQKGGQLPALLHHRAPVRRKSSLAAHRQLSRKLSRGDGSGAQPPPPLTTRTSAFTRHSHAHHFQPLELLKSASNPHISEPQK